MIHWLPRFARCSKLLSLGAGVEILDPPEARAELTAVAVELAALYGVPQ